MKNKTLEELLSKTPLKSRVKISIVTSFINLMSSIGNDKPTDRQLFRLLVLFYKRGFRNFDFENEYSKQYYIDRMKKFTIDTFDDWWYWSDRCNFLRSKVLHDMIKRDRSHVWDKFNKWTKLKYRVR